MVQLDEEIFKLLEDGSNIQYEQPQRAKEIFFEAQSRAQALENHKLNIVAGFNLGTVLINNGEPRNGVEQLLKALGDNIKYNFRYSKCINPKLKGPFLVA